MQSNELLAKSVAAEVSSYLREPLSILKQVDVMTHSHEHVDRDFNLMLESIVQESVFLSSIYILDSSKKITHIGLRDSNDNDTDNYIGLDLSGMGILSNIEFLQGPYWSEFFSSPVTGQKSVSIILPSGEDSYILGLFDINLLHQVMLERSSMKKSFIIVLDDSGNPIFHPDFNIVEEQHSFFNITPFQEAQLGNFGTYSFSLSNVEYLSSSAIISETKWLVMVVQGLETAREPVRSMAKFFIFAVLIAGVIVAVFSIIQLRRLMQPLQALQDNIQAVAKGDYQGENVAKLALEEFEQVAFHFRQMAIAIERREQMLEINEERLMSLLEVHNLKHLAEDELLEFALEQAVRLTRSEIGYLHILDDRESVIERSLWSGEINSFYEKYSMSSEDLQSSGLWYESLEKRTEIIRNQKKENSTYKEDGSPMVLRQLCVPIFDGEKIVAAVGALNKMTDYDSTDARQLSLYFNHTWDILQQKRSEKDRERLTEQLSQAQKLEAIGTLAGGIAHDFNNVLMVIIGNAEIAKDNVDKPDKVKQDLDQIFKAALRARDLVNQILAFSRNSTEGLKSLDIRPIVKEAVKLLRSTIPTNIEISQDIYKESKPVMSEPGQINQLIMNLCTNAYQAMEGDSGKLEIALRPETLRSDLYHSGKLAVSAGEYMLLGVKDDGRGIPQEYINRIFEPYYTTREKERGTGLGLAVVHGIVKGLKGAIIVTSDLGVGTEFKVYLPVAQQSASDQEQLITGSLPGGNERILYIDDDEAVAQVNSKILEGLGYKVTTFTSSNEAYLSFAADADGYDIVISDIAMPELTGDMLARKIKQIKSEIPIILCTGYSEKVDEEKAKELGINELILKPLTRIDLALTVRKVLGFKSKVNETD